MTPRILTASQVNDAAVSLGYMLLELFSVAKRIRVWGVPRGGIPAAYALAATNSNRFQVVDTPEHADLIVDDLIDSGATCVRFAGLYPHLPFSALFAKRPIGGVCVGAIARVHEWLVFPWEASAAASSEDIFTRLIEFVGDDPARPGLKETPARAAKAWEYWSSGYIANPAETLKHFEDGAERYDQLVLQRSIPVYSHCEHHLAPFFGVAHIAYIPDGRIVGLSKISRLVDIFSRRLQVQERLTCQIADALMEHLKPKGVGVVLECRHLCMESRGVQRQGTETLTSALRGVMGEAGARSEFLALARTR